jgi:hypothetical protein
MKGFYLMSKKMSSRHLLKNSPKPVSGWDEAVFDAETMLKEAQDKVRRLAETVRVFKRRRDNGEPFFGEEAKREKNLEG